MRHLAIPLQVSFAIILLWMPYSGAEEAVAPTAPPQAVPKCDQHPPMTRDTVKRARDAIKGIRDERQKELDDIKKEGKAVGPINDAGGGECPDETTPRGVAAGAVVSILYNGQLHCSGIVVSPTMVLTAAHCVKEFDKDKMEVVVGSNSAEPVQRTRVYLAAWYSDKEEVYDASKFGVHDLAYIYLKQALTEATPVRLPNERLPSWPLPPLFHVGYGIAGSVPGVRRCVDIPVDAKCSAAYSYQTKHLNTCNGDSGGGAFRDISEDIPVLVGMTIWGDEACTEFGVDVDTGEYSDWIKFMKSKAPNPTRPATVEPGARKMLRSEPDAFLRNLEKDWYHQLDWFKDSAEGKWVTWSAYIKTVERHTPEAVHGDCTLNATAGQRTYLQLKNFPGGCEMESNQSIQFTGRLAGLHGHIIEIAQAELLSQEQVPIVPIAHYSLVQTGELKLESRAQNVKLESQPGEWTGRVKDCVPFPVEPPWELDQSQGPPGFSPKNVNHGGWDPVQNITPNSFCIPLWAEGVGGKQLFGGTVELGSAGVVDGDVTYIVKRTNRLPKPRPLSSGEITSNGSRDLSFPQLGGEYELTITLKDGTERRVQTSDQIGPLRITWSDTGVKIEAQERPQSPAKQEPAP